MPIDMGGYQLAKDLAENPVVGSYAGVLISATFGCTLVFTIPVGMEIVEEKTEEPLQRVFLPGLPRFRQDFWQAGFYVGFPFWKCFGTVCQFLFCPFCLVLD